MRRGFALIPLCIWLGLSAVAQEQPWQASYQEATALAGEAKVDAALAALAAAFDAGLTNVEQVLHDPAFDSLHGHPQFRALLKPHMDASSLRLCGEAEPGSPIVVRGVVLDAESVPAAGAEILAFHADASGKYTREKAMDEPHARLFGYLRCDENGRFELSTIFPGYYPERLDEEGPARSVPAHIHLEITTGDGKVSKVQLVFADDPRMGHEHWRKWASEHGHPIARVRQSETGKVADAAILLRE